jgi:hypothetical protein
MKPDRSGNYIVLEGPEDDFYIRGSFLAAFDHPDERRAQEQEHVRYDPNTGQLQMTIWAAEVAVKMMERDTAADDVGGSRSVDSLKTHIQKAHKFQHALATHQKAKP